MGILEQLLQLYPAGRSFGGTVAVNPFASPSSASPITAPKDSRPHPAPALTLRVFLHYHSYASLLRSR